MLSHIHSESLMAVTTSSDEVREGRMINFNSSFWVLREWNNGLDMNKEIVAVIEDRKIIM